MPDHLQPCRNLLQHFGDGLAEPGQARGIAAAAAAVDLRLVLHHLARQVGGQRLAPAGPLTWPGFGLRLRLRRFGAGRDLLAQVLLEILQPHLELVDGAVQLLGGLAIALAPQCGQLHPHVLDLEQRRGQPGLEYGSLGELRLVGVAFGGQRRDDGAVLRHFQTQTGDLLLGRRRLRHAGSLFDSPHP